jgi:TonB family protein
MRDYNVPAMHLFPRYLLIAPLVALTLFPIAKEAHATDAERQLRDQYRDKMLVLRGFHSGDQLHYDSSGVPIGAPSSGDWTTDGFVSVKEIRSAQHHLLIDARRLLVIEPDEKGFALADEKDNEKRKLQIDVDLDLNRANADQAAAALSKIFLTAQDSLADLVPDYWVPCVRDAAAGADATFSFTSELLATPGATTPARRQIEDRDGPNCRKKTGTRKGVHPVIIPPMVSAEFSEHARKAGIQGTVMLKFVVSEEGLPVNIRVIKPLGYGLDWNAVSAVKQWRFKPVEVDERPIAMELATEVDFRRY